MTYESFILTIISTRGQWAEALIEQKFKMHHILPKSMGGLPKYPGKKSKHYNIIWLTETEHFVAHKLLALENLNSLPLLNAFWLMYQATKKANSFEVKNFCTDLEISTITASYKDLLSRSSRGANNNFYNKTHSVETLKKLSEKLRGKKVSEAQKCLMSNKMKGKYKGMVFVYKNTITKRIPLELLPDYESEGWIRGNGRKEKIKLTTTEKELISKKTKEGFSNWKENNPEEYAQWRKKISEASAGRVLSDEAKHKISLANSGSNNGMYKVASPNRKKVYCKELDLIFETISEASEYTKVGRSHISRCCKGTYGFKTAGGYHWSYIETQDKEE